ncbi:MAG: acyl-CoA carboxylase epsilon subunit [Arthrobacter sp.]|uniref:acyl-CoA carboxylase epsilon subunit n=1 Tax=unclassified Arthrobacter TaxID=235627 RepID=UPI0026521EB3|nr:acyl-CoA carboxylase subunit epsilon [Micrococcaceae bacterium]MDN5813843.1 acyl-CoA carboxylase subunit epsilon [Micrococcaceae bacterium]MDN5824901.1 acyl-CoA carboxylase subunit epsilon [Micrococcaceae bacterium]MDN5879866.1 acyl-CoA carboxylase subunit epsilon [Micrococcaceae bacterium]MDN5887420.1 acyl-CoA carboxylase subunit epsilon [Micrococcaceae bacterium]
MTGSTDHQNDAGTPAPLFQVVRGNPDDVDVAALAAVLAALPGEAREPQGIEAATSRREVMRNQAWQRRHLAGQPGPWRSGRS